MELEQKAIEYHDLKVSKELLEVKLEKVQDFQT